MEIYRILPLRILENLDCDLTRKNMLELFELFCIFVLKKQRIYIDTSVVRGYFDDEFSESTLAFFRST